jgi:UPI00016E4815 related cluster
MPVKTKIAEQIMSEIDTYLQKKDDLDMIMNLSHNKKEREQLSVDKVENSEGYMTLLSEGSVLYQDDTIRLYICKGTLKKWYDSIDGSFEGYVSTGHRDLNSYPVREGYFRKSDLKLVEDSNGRYDLLVKPHVNLELSNVKDLIIQDEPFAISSEFLWYSKEIEDSDIEEYAKLVVYNVEHGGGIDVPITDTIEITGFSFVGNPGNAKSGGYEPSLLVRNEEEYLNRKEVLDKVLAHLSTQAEEVVEAPEAEVVEPTTEEVVEEVAVETEEVVEPTEEVTEEEVVEEDALTKAIEAIEALTAEKEQLLEENAELKNKLSAKEAEEQKIDEKFQKLSALLEKANPSVEQTQVKQEEVKANRFGRVRFGG